MLNFFKDFFIFGLFFLSKKKIKKNYTIKQMIQTDFHYKKGKRARNIE